MQRACPAIVDLFHNEVLKLHPHCCVAFALAANALDQRLSVCCGARPTGHGLELELVGQRRGDAVSVALTSSPARRLRKVCKEGWDGSSCEQRVDQTKSL